MAKLLTKKELDKLLLSKLEWDDFEFKLAANNIPKDAWETVSAFANTNGGNIIFGIKQSGGTFEVSGVEDPEKMSSDFLTTLRGEKFNIPLASKPQMFNISGNTVMSFYIPGMPRQAKPVYFNEIRNTFLRHGGTDQRATKQEIERFLREASESSSDSMILPGASVSDLDKESIQRFMNLFRNNLKTKVFGAFSETEVLKKLGLVRREKNKNPSVKKQYAPIIAPKETKNASKDQIVSPANLTENAPIKIHYAPKEQEIAPLKIGEDFRNTLPEVQISILAVILMNPKLIYDEIALILKKDRATVKRNIQKMKQFGILKRIGGRKIGHWEILQQ